MKGKIVSDIVAVQEEVERKRKELGNQEFFKRLEAVDLAKQKREESLPEERSELYGDATIQSILKRNPTLTRQEVLEMAKAFGF